MFNLEGLTEIPRVLKDFPYIERIKQIQTKLLHSIWTIIHVEYKLLNIQHVHPIQIPPRRCPRVIF